MLSVSNYHYIRPSFNAPFPSIYGITPVAFREQLLLIKNEADFINPNTLLANFEEIVYSKSNYFLITFDDGLKEQFDNAMPILDSLNIPAAFFANSSNYEHTIVSTVHKIHLLRSLLPSNAFLIQFNLNAEDILKKKEQLRAQEIYQYDDKEAAELKYLLNFKLSFNAQKSLIDNMFAVHFAEDEVGEGLYMSKKNLVDLANLGYLGSHSHHHYPLGLLDNVVLRNELEHSKEYFETLSNTAIEMISYPYGTPEACTAKVAAQARRTGYQLGFTTGRGANTRGINPLLLNRFDCNDVPGGKNYKNKL